MTEESAAIVPVWTLATGEARVPAMDLDEPMTAERLSELRGVLAALVDHPIATLEVHPLPEKLDRSRGIALDAASPLAHHLSDLITRSARSSQVVRTATAADEVLYRMVVPKKFAAQLGQGLVSPMRSKAVPGAIRGPLRDAAGIVGGASFVPVGGAAATGAGGASAAAVGAGGAAAAGTAVAGGTALTVAAPLVLMAVAVAASAAAEQQRREAIEHITELLEQLLEQNLDQERSDLDGCRDAIDKATAILLDEGKLGVSLGLDSAVHAIGTALAKADRRLAKWQRALDKWSEGVELDILVESFPGIDSEGGIFRTHLELAALAIALKRQVIVLQAVEHAQGDPGNPLENFARALRADQQRLDKLESDLASVLVRLSDLELARPRGFRAPVFTYGEVDRLMGAAHRIHALGDGVAVSNQPADVLIDIARNRDGSVIAFPARPA
jgi:tetratricopeptide (TPR) repeat protein